MEVPKPPWYRRFWSLVFAAYGVFGLALVVALVALWPQDAQRPVDPAAAVGSRAEQIRSEAIEAETTLPTSTTTRLEPGVLWQRRGSDGYASGLFSAPDRWQISWSFDCQNFAAHGGGNFKLSGNGDFEEVSIQRVGVRGSGRLQITGGGRGRLTVESVCDRWAVKAVRRPGP